MRDANNNPDALYAQLDEAELASVARKTYLDVEDIQQEARLICWAICAGRSDYDPHQGSVRQYVMGKLWGLSYRHTPGISLGEGTNGDSRLVALHWLAASATEHQQAVAGPLDFWVREEDEREAQALRAARTARLLDALPPIDRALARLVLAGASSASCAASLGLTPRAGRYRVQRIVERIETEGAKCF